MNIYDRILELSQCGYLCSQILAILLLETVGEENPSLVKTMGGLCGGVGFSGGCCGCITAGACFISYFTGKGCDDEPAHDENKNALMEFTTYLSDFIKADYGCTDCRVMIKGDPANRVEVCPPIIAETYAKCMEILSEKGLI